MNENIKIADLMTHSGVAFGTSGVRGLVQDMTDKVCFAYVAAFLHHLLDNKQIKQRDRIGIAGDLRSSTPRIMNAVAAACKQMQFEVVNYGHIPSPALALTGIEKKIATIMVTGSHIPDDRNGIKFNTPSGEILKQDEQGMRRQQVNVTSRLFDGDALIQTDNVPDVSLEAQTRYIQRFTDFFPTNCLQGKHIGIYEHSSVTRDCLTMIFRQLGAKVTCLGRSDDFIAVDTEAIRPEDIKSATEWAKQYQFDCIVSTDGDGDRPLISDEYGNWLRGDIAGILCAKYLDAECVVTPVSSNSAVEKCGYFKRIVRTKIGSPYVIEAMQNIEKHTACRVVAYEANGGFLQQSVIEKNNKQLMPLPTRDAVIVPLAVLLLAKEQGKPVSQVIENLPARYTYSDRLKNFPIDASHKIMTMLLKGNRSQQLEMIGRLFNTLPTPVDLDTTDGVRITFSNENVIHLRPSGNAPELRCYTESDSQEQAKELNSYALSVITTLKLS